MFEPMFWAPDSSLSRPICLYDAARARAILFDFLGFDAPGLMPGMMLLKRVVVETRSFECAATRTLPAPP